MGRTKYVVYLRVSTKKQGASGLGIEAQRKMCNDLITREGGIMFKEFTDVESGKSRTRPGLWNAIDFCKAQGCTLVIAKLDRLARDVEFTFKVMNTGIQIKFCDMPIMNTMILGVFASVAQYERELCSSRTKAALAEIKSDIQTNGGHFSRAGKWVKKLGREKGADTSAGSTVSALNSAKRADEWRTNSPLYAFVERQILKGRPRNEILADARSLYERNPANYSTRNGCALCAGTLSKWVREIRITV